MYRVVQYRISSLEQSTRCWNYKTESGARRRVWLCNLSLDNILAFYYCPETMPKTLSKDFFLPTAKLLADYNEYIKSVPNSFYLGNSKLWNGFIEYLKSKEVEDDE